MVWSSLPAATAPAWSSAHPSAPSPEPTRSSSRNHASGVHRAATLNVAVAALTTVPNNATRPPVVLLNGWISRFTNSCPVATSSSETFGNLAQYLVSDGAPVVYLFDNCLEGADDTIETLAQDLGTFLNSIMYDQRHPGPANRPGGAQHGRVDRAGLPGRPSAGREPLTPPTPTLVRDLVMIAVPNFGSFVAGIIPSLSPPAARARSLSPPVPSCGTWPPGTSTSTICAASMPSPSSATPAPTSEGSTSPPPSPTPAMAIVSLTSASLDFVLQGAGTTRIVPYCHVDPSAFTNTNLGTYECNAPGHRQRHQHFAPDRPDRALLPGRNLGLAVHRHHARHRPLFIRRRRPVFRRCQLGKPVPVRCDVGPWGTLPLHKWRRHRYHLLCRLHPRNRRF